MMIDADKLSILIQGEPGMQKKKKIQGHRGARKQKVMSVFFHTVLSPVGWNFLRSRDLI